MKLQNIVFNDNIIKEDYIIAKYYIESKSTIKEAAWAIAIGQSVGNPSVRNEWENDELFTSHVARILVSSQDNRKGIVDIAFPITNIDLKEDGVSQLLCFLMGGHLDIDIIKVCHLIDIQNIQPWYRPDYGLSGIRKLTGIYEKPLLGGIIKPKTGLTPNQLLDMTKMMVDGGVNFIKEDEILGNPNVCPFYERVELISKYLQCENVIYCFCVNGDSWHTLEKAATAIEEGCGIHVNFWSGLGIYKAIKDYIISYRDKDRYLPNFIHFQKSGIKILSDNSHRYHIDWSVLCKLAALSGVDSIHVGMIGGYANDEQNKTKKLVTYLQNFNVIPTLSCGMHPGIVNSITKEVGVDYLANVGGAIHGHPQGTLAGVKAMRQAIDGNYNKEYYEAVDKWGLN